MSKFATLTELFRRKKNSGHIYFLILIPKNGYRWFYRFPVGCTVYTYLCQWLINLLGFKLSATVQSLHARHAISIIYYWNLGITYNREKSWRMLRKKTIYCTISYNHKQDPTNLQNLHKFIFKKGFQDIRKLGGSHNNIRF